MIIKNFLKTHILFFISYLSLLFLYLLYINLHYLEGIPHVPDSVAYLFMAKMFASGNIIVPITANPDHFRFFDGTLVVDGGKWLFQYPFGHPLLLTGGILLGIPQVIPPLIGTLTVLELIIISILIYSRKTLFFLLPLPFLSPFFLENSASFMSHSTAAFYLTSSLLCLILALKRSHNLLFLLSGICIGLLFNTRPLTALPFLLFVAFIIYLKKGAKKEGLTSLFFYCLGFTCLFLLWMAYNFYTTGSPLVSQYFEVNKGIFGFGQNESLAVFLMSRLANTMILTKNFFPMLYNLPVGITLILFSSFLFLRHKLLWDKLFFVSLFFLPLTYFFYNGTFLMYGPRFWYEMIPFTFLITARICELLYETFGKIVVILFIFLSIVSLLRFYSVIPVTNPDFFSPLRLKDLRGFNFVDNRIPNIIKKQNIKNAVVFVADCNGNWWCYGSVFSNNSPYLTTDILYVRDLKEENQKIMQQYPTKSYYRINYDTLEITTMK